MVQTDIDLRDVFRILRRRWWILLALPLVVGLVAGLVSLYVLQPVYQASTTIWVVKEGSGPISMSDVTLSRSLTKTYAEVAKSRAVMQKVIENYQVKHLSLEALQNKLTVTTVRDTEILSFTIRDQNPQWAAFLADAVAEAFKGQITKQIKVDNVTVVDLAVVPQSPVSPRPLLNVALAIVLGGMAALGLIFLLEVLDTTIKTPDDVARYLGLTVLGVIPVINPDSKTIRPTKRRSTRSTPAQVVTGK